MDDSTTNTSGYGKEAIVPPEIQWFNWGAQFYRWAWAQKYGIKLDPDVVIGSAFNFFFWGWHGNELAWRYKRWDSIESFNEAQRKDSARGKTLYIGILALVIVLIGSGIIYTVVHSR